ncbi:hypothetical protein B1R27_00605 [Streptomyces sp. GKU 895]|nr:hypothetical protein B1R27_00605 [Streptomyces sp. GKU 895]
MEVGEFGRPEGRLEISGAQYVLRMVGNRPHEDAGWHYCWFRRTVIVVVSVAVLAIAVAGGVVWSNAGSYDDSSPTASGALILSNTIDKMPTKDKDPLSYRDDGTINDSID